MLSTQDKEFLKLLLRSPDRGDGWRSVSTACWQLIETFGEPDLIETKKEQMRVRLSNEGKTVVRFLV